MLGKLIKYDIKAMSKIIVPFWAALLILGWVIAIQNHFRKVTQFSTMNVLMIVIAIVIITAVFVMNIVIVIQRFWRGLLKEEGYLMFTLPISARNLILSKLISALLISLGTVFVIIFMFLPWILIGGDLKNLIFAFRNFDFNNVKWMISVIAIVIAEIASSIYHVYAAMAIGQLSNRNRFLFSFAAFIAISIIQSILSVLAMDVLGFEGNVFEDDKLFYLIVSVIQCVIYHIITEYLLSRKLNLE